ncbi:MAG: peptidylprolyl isomerase [Porticoccaceae bacterium]
MSQQQRRGQGAGRPGAARRLACAGKCRWRLGLCAALAGWALGGAAGAVAEAAAEPAAELIATGRNLVLTRERLRAELAPLPPEVLDRLASDPQAALTFVNGLAKLDAFAAEAERTGVAARPEVRVAVETARARVLGDALRQQVLETLHEPDFEALARERYLSERQSYQKPERARVRHILLKLAADADAAAVEAKRGELAAIATRVRAGESFGPLARQYSEDEGSAGLGGDLPEFGRGQMVAPFEAAAFALREPGELSEPVRSQYGWHLIQSIHYQAPGPMSFEEAKKFIVSKLRLDYRREYVAAWERDLLESARVEVDADRLRVLMGDARARLAQLPVDGAAPATGP